MRRARSVVRRTRAAVGRIPLLVAVILAVAGGVAIAAGAGWAAVAVLGTKNEPAAPLDITKVALVVAGGVGGAVALVVAYRRQRDLESARFIERFGAAATQLGSPYTAVRIAGVYAMAVVADESTGERRQQCIDVLCGYLRLPYSPDTGANHQTGRDRKDTSTADVEIEDHFQYLQNDKVVRQTIVRVIAAHLRDHDNNWSNNNFDFTTAHFEDADFHVVRFSGITRFEEATFTGPARFGGTTFSGPARFDRATFTDTARFGGATFIDTARFSEATFSGPAEFGRATFTDTAGFSGAAFTDTTWFREATFSSAAWFEEATFTGAATFDGTTFSGTARFEEATFTGAAWFAVVTFTGAARFGGARFTDTARFDRVTFADTAEFGRATFDGSGRVGATISFRRVDFGSGAVSFDDPRCWGPPTPAFDWDADPAAKPANVSPTPWPPTPVP
ncbi:pentapeptide repeat-containing protein [Nocardia brasiliensis]